MSRFDAHGNALTGQAPSAAPALNVSGMDAKANHWLTGGVLGSVGKAG